MWWLVALLVGVLHEGWSAYRQQMDSQWSTSLIEYSYHSKLGQVLPSPQSHWVQLKRTLAHLIQLIINMAMMLLVMTWDHFIWLGLVIGVGSGFFFFHRPSTASL